MADLITTFGTEQFTGVFSECKEHYGVGDAERYEWPNNVLSSRTVVYDSGVIARRGDQVVHSVDPNELALCQRLAAGAEQIMQDLPIGMGSES